MSNFKMRPSRFSQFMSGKGFYIALALCLVAIGSAAYIAANGTFKNLGITSSSEVSAASDGAAQTGNIVSGVTGGLSSSSESSSSSAVSSAAKKTSSATSSSKTSSAAPTYYIMPVTGNVITAYSPNTPVYDKTMDDWRVSDCVDIAADLGTPVKACADGKVLDVKADSMLGEEVIIQHSGGLQSIYANLSTKVAVKKGQSIEAGTVIGAVGQTAQSEISLVPHLHFAMMKNGQTVDPLVTVKSSK